MNLAASVRIRNNSAPTSNKEGIKKDARLIPRRRVYSGTEAFSPSKVPSQRSSILNKQSKQKVKLEYVIGQTAVGPNSLAVDAKTGTVARLAGACVVLSSECGKHPEGHLIKITKHSFTCLAISPCGRFVATGESGHRPCVRIWEVRDQHDNFTGHEVRQLAAHAVAIVAVRFVPGSSLLVSVGTQHDGQICVWDWRSGIQLATGKVSAAVNSLAISPDNSMCVTVGSKHVKFWYLPAADAQKGGGLQSRSAILADRRSSTFVDATFVDANRLLAVTYDGWLVEFNNKKYVNTYKFETITPMCICTTPKHVVLGCGQGVVQFCDKTDLSELTAFPRCVYLGMDPSVATDVTQLIESNHPEGVGYGDVRAVVYNGTTGIYTAIFADRSMRSFSESTEGWDMKSSSLAHVGSINAIQVYPSCHPYLPSGSFLTGGSDGTVRIWNTSPSIEQQSSSSLSTNLLSPLLKKIIFVEEDMAALIEPRDESALVPVPTEASSSTTGIRCLAVSHDGKHLVAGTKGGNLHITNLSDPSMPIVDVIDAHDHDVTCVEYSDPSTDAPWLLASGGRDRLVHVFRPSSSNYTHAYIIDDHQSTVNSIKFVKTADNFFMYTCANDKVIIIRRLVKFDQDTLEFQRDNQISAPVALNDVLVSRTGNSLLAACQDRQLRAYSLSGKSMNTVKGTGGDADTQNGHLNKLSLDPSGTFAASVCTDKLVYVVEVRSGHCVAAVGATGEQAQDVAFSEDCRHLYIVSANGCLYIWRVANSLWERMVTAKKALDEITERSISPDSVLGSGSEAVSEEKDEQDRTFDESLAEFGADSWIQPLAEKCSILSISSNSSSRNQPLVVRPAQVTRRSTSNLLGTLDNPEDGSDADGESQSDFISKRSPAVQQYTSSKSMLNIREGGMLQTALGNQLDRPPRRARANWDPPSPDNWQPNNNNPGTFQMTSSPLKPGNGMFSPSENISPVHGWPPTPQHHSRLRQEGRALSPSQAGLAQISRLQNSSSGSSASGSSGFKRDTPDRVSYTKRYLQQNHESPGRPMWTPQSITPSSRRTSSNVNATSPSGAAASAITRRQSELFRVRFLGRQEGDNGNAAVQRARTLREQLQKKEIEEPSVEKKSPRSTRQELPPRAPTNLKADDYANSSLHLRSRSQSPNHMAIRQGISSRTLTQELQKRRDSDMSYTAISSRMTPASSRSNLRGPEETRKSTDALNKMAAIRSKLHQSNENLAKSSDNLSTDMFPSTRTRSISNLRGGPLETFGTFDVDNNRTRTDSLGSNSLAHSRILARSVGNVSNNEQQDETESRLSRMANTMNMLKKASNPDLTEMGQYEEQGIGMAERRRRGAVQKKVERYHPRNRTTGRNQTSEDSDTASDASPLNQSINNSRRSALNAANNRSVSSVEGSLRSFNGAAPQSKRLFEQQKYSNSTGRRTPNYLAQRMAGEDMGAPDLGSDESPRSSINATEWAHLLEQGNESTQMVRHVQDCLEQLQVQADKTMQAKKLVEESQLSPEQKRIVSNQIELITEKIMTRLNPMGRSTVLGDGNGNEYAPIHSNANLLKGMMSSIRQ